MECRCSCSSEKTEPPCGSPRSLPSKLAIHRDISPDALDWLLEFMQDEREALLALSAGRHAWGHFRYGDSLMYEYDAPRLRAEIAEELADAINYAARLLELMLSSS